MDFFFFKKLTTFIAVCKTLFAMNITDLKNDYEKVKPLCTTFFISFFLCSK